MIAGIGNDITDIRRIEKSIQRFGESFITRCFTEEERERAGRCATLKAQAAIYAKRFAAKEACAKALGVGFTQGVRMRDIGVGTDENGRPFLVLAGGALKRLEAITPQERTAILHVSLSDEGPYAQAFVVIETI
ncbi:MAG: holo-ACP synthase [Alphaproteobacteria bacterium]